MLKRQRQARTKDEGDMEIDTKEEDWTLKDDEDLIARTVADFRLQRLSMVQTLRQFVLCYETVLEWIVDEMPERFKGLAAAAASSDKDRWSWGG
jgi:protein-tyrosine phosphatase